MSGKKRPSSKDNVEPEVTSSHPPEPCTGVTLGLIDALLDQHYPGLRSPVRACLAVCATMSLKGRTKPLTLILEGGSGSGKTAALQMLMPKAEPHLNNYIYRSDKFTPRAFVSHAANVKARDMQKLDLIDRLRDKILLTKELAPIFGGRDEELRDNIAILISVLDGEGFISDSGMRGRRGYDKPILFNWLGATTPLQARVHRMMSQLGTRLLFFAVPTFELTDVQLLDYARNGKPDEAAAICNQAINTFLHEFYQLHPIGCVEPDSVGFPEHLLEELIRWAQLLVKGRAEVLTEKDNGEPEPVSAAQPEGIWRVVDYFKELALGHALLYDRKNVDSCDLVLIGHVAISSIPGHVRPVLTRLREANCVTSGEVEKLCRVTRPTARKRLRELEVLGISSRTSGSTATNQPDSVSLTPEFAWLRKPGP